MKLDGHAKLTNSAIRAFKSRCSRATEVFLDERMCELPQFNTWDINWTGLGSNENDNMELTKYIIIQELSVIGESFHDIKNGYLTRKVVAVDLELPKIFYHFFDFGQKYHFMRRADGSTVRNAHQVSVEFIKQEAMKWIELMTDALYAYRVIGRSGGGGNVLREKAVSHLALALHSLQDSFSSGHTKRATYNTVQYPGAIKDIYIYSDQDAHKHSNHDFDSASTNSILSRSAVYASADLLRMCALSVLMKSVEPIDWDAFENRWLKLSA